MVASVVSEYHWPPAIVGGLFIDEQDHYGLEYWYNEVVAIDNRIKTIPTTIQPKR